MIELSHEELVRRVKHIRLVLSDNDGVLTDNGVYYSERGEVMKRYSIRDGMGVERLEAAGIATGVMTGEISANLRARSEKLKIRYLYLGVKDKRARLHDVLSENRLELHEVAYIGDDINDVSIMEEIARKGITACPGDAMDFVRPLVHYICKAEGGRGAFREFAEWILRMRNS
ncbi:MAG: HAD-IIIA family hydrolase [Chlorobium phaeobacteroides]|uniref:3-deoxy-D-manno-octulosonate 8-phosphate phosphatase, YrbI family n=1 Tax=Chlorobium phaeobacteroides (strain BS1) TaxID=331678 RepID=B3EQU7_CHLPB|nr:HAD-IIIA family hydrolase [Chlorobium phaeobacteroides]